MAAKRGRHPHPPCLTLRTQGMALVRARPDLFALAAGTAFLVNLFTFLAIRHVSSTSFKVSGGQLPNTGLREHLPPAEEGRMMTLTQTNMSELLPLFEQVAGCLKNMLVVWGGVAQGDVVTAQELQVRGSAWQGASCCCGDPGVSRAPDCTTVTLLCCRAMA